MSEIIYVIGFATINDVFIHVGICDHFSINISGLKISISDIPLWILFTYVRFSPNRFIVISLLLQK